MLGTKFLQWLTRYGLDARILQDYRAYGLRYLSRRNLTGTADISKFVDYDGVDRSIIKKSCELELLLNAEIYHVIWNSTTEIIFMFVNRERDIDFQLNLLKQGEVDSIKYNIKTNKWNLYQLHPEVNMGAIIDVDYKINM